MSYSPTPQDFPATPKASGYIPSSDDFDVEVKPAKSKSNDFFQSLAKGNQYAKKFAAPDAETKGQVPTPENFKDFTKGAAQEIGNYPSKIANLAGANAPLMDIAPNTESGKNGMVGGDIASFFMPGGAAKLGINALSKIPAAAKGINAVSAFGKAHPFAKGAAEIGGAGANVGMFNAANHPESKIAQAENGAIVGGEGQAAINMIAAKNPIVKLLGRAGLGALFGSTVGSGHAETGAAIASLFPELKGLLIGSSHTKMAKNALEGIEPADVAKSVAANKLLDTNVTPAQAAGNYVTGANEARLASTPAADRTMQAEKETQKSKEKAAIKKVLNGIYRPTKKNNADINSAYDKANKMNVNASHAANIDPAEIAALRDDPILHDAWEAVGKKSSTRNTPRNNFEFLSEVKKHLDREYKKFRYVDPNHGVEILKTQQRYNKFLGDVNPDYAAANKLAQPKIVRRNIQERFNKNEEDMTGKNFYNKFFNTEKNTNWLMNEAKNFPQAIQHFKAMQDGWRHLSNMKSVGAAAGQAAQKTDQARNTITAIIDHIKKLSGSQNDIKQIKYIHNTDQWAKDINKISQIKDHTEMLKQAMNLFGRIGAAYGLSPNSKHQIIDHSKDLPSIH